jgi:anti-sigma factor RsiW
MSSNCEYYQQLISQMLDGDLLEPEQNALQSHLQTCPDCQALYAAFSDISDAMQADMVSPPEALTPGVMARIQADNDAPASQDPANTIEALSSRGKRVVRRWPSYVAAACLVVLIGAGLTSSLRSSVSTASDTAAAMPETAMAIVTEAEESETAQRSAGTAQTYNGADMEAAADDSITGSVAQSYSLAEEADMEAAEEGTLDSGPAHTILNPAQVPEGREADFEALLTDAGWPDGEPDETWHSLYAAEYHGVIYEFLTDDQEQYLLWHDAAEGLYTHSRATVDDLWNIFDN